MMKKDGTMVGEVNFMEIIHVKLSNKRRNSIMSIVSRKDHFLKPFLIEDTNSFELGVPINDFSIFFGLDRYKFTLRMLHSLLMNEAGLS